MAYDYFGNWVPDDDPSAVNWSGVGTYTGDGYGAGQGSSTLPVNSPLADGVDGLGNAPLTWMEKLAAQLPAIAAFLNSQQLARVNVERAKRGQPPLNTGAYGPQVGVQLDPGTKQFATYALLGVGAFMLLNKRGRRR
jgi:hypothetical protein